MKKIAVVEDNPDNRLLVQVILEPLYEVVEFETGPGALAGLPKEKADLVLLDISLPEMDGTEVLRRIRADEQLQSLPVIALTAHAMAGDREKAMEAGCSDYDTKPVEMARLLGKMSALMGQAPTPSRAPHISLPPRSRHSGTTSGRRSTISSATASSSWRTPPPTRTTPAAPRSATRWPAHAMCWR